MKCSDCDNYQPKPKQSVHQRGERFEGEVSDSAALPPKGSHLAYAEECRTPKRGERFVYKCITAGTAGMNFAGVERPHVTVTCWDKQARETSYGFYGDVDWKRLQRDTFGEGAEVVLLSPNLFIAGPVACGIYAGKYQYILARRIYKNLAAWSYTTNDGICGSHCSARDDTILPAAIIAAIREHKPPSCDACEHEYEAVEEPKPPEWWEEAKWLQDGWWVVWRGNGRPMTVDHVKDDRVYCNDRLAHKDWHPSNLSAANLDDLAYTVDGVQYWAYEDEVGDVRVNTDNGPGGWILFGATKIFRATYPGKIMKEAQWNWLQAQKGK